MQEPSANPRRVIPLSAALAGLAVVGWAALLTYWAFREPAVGNTAEISLKEWSEWLTALGTCGAVFVALWQLRGARDESASQRYFERAEMMVRTVVSDFISKTD